MATRVVEWKKLYTWWKAISIDENKVISLNLRDENNLIIYDAWDDEIYVDLQLPDEIQPLDAFPVWITTGRVISDNGWDAAGTIICAKTTSGDNIKILYEDNGKLWIDNGTWVFKQIYLKGDIDALLQALRNYVDTELAKKQDTLIAGNNISIAADWKTISATLPPMSRFLSLRDCATWQPVSFPASVPFTYLTWDHYLVENVSSATPPVNYKPDGSSYTGYASSTTETGNVAVWDVYIYDGTTWLLQKNTEQEVSFSQIAWQPTDNSNLATALGAKQDTLTAWNHIDITNNTVSTTWLQEELTAWENITIEDICTTESDMKWPAPSGFHVPLISEWQWLKSIMDWLSLTTWDSWRINLHMPFAWFRLYISWGISYQWTIAYYSSSSAKSWTSASFLFLDSSNVNTNYSDGYYARALSIRCFNNSYIAPDSSWIIILGTLGGAWIFRNQTNWLISITSDWTTGYTIMDKNLWATTVYNDWDTLSEANCGKYYQWGNNYWFDWIWWNNPTISSTQVDASNYWPGNYYSSDIFIKWNRNRDNSWNSNLRWWVTQWTFQDCIYNVISAWAAPSGWISLDANSPMTVTTMRVGTQAQYEALQSYSNTTVYLTI